jgi:hypothetical protein
MVFILLGGSSMAQNGEMEDLFQFQPVPASAKDHFLNQQRSNHVLADPGYYIWGTTVIRWTDGKYHAYYSRWADSLGFGAWMTHCEIAHAVSDRPEGPFQFVDVAISHRHLDGWDVINAHNPAVCVADGKICLYYISNDLKGKYEADTGGAFPDLDWFRENRLMVRNSQRIGVAIATDPGGPFERVAKPVVEPHGAFKKIAVNPAVAYVDGLYTMVMKGDDVRHEETHRIQLVGHAGQPEGPFTFRQEPVYAKVQTEDAGLWYDYQKQLYYMTCHVMFSPDLALFSSKDSYHWQPAKSPVFKKKVIQLDDGSIWQPNRMERPFVLTDEEGQPVMLYVAVFDEDKTGNVAIPM